MVWRGRVVLLLSVTCFGEALRVVDVEEPLDTTCTKITVTDRTKCGVQAVTKTITDVLACGTRRVCVPFVGCHNVPKQCVITEELDGTCEVDHFCPVTLMGSASGTGTITSMNDISITAKVEDLKVVRGQSTIKDTINANTHFLMPLTEGLVNMAMVEVSKQVSVEVGTLKSTLMKTINDQNIGKFFSVVNRVDAERAITDILNVTWDRLSGNIAPRARLQKAQQVGNWRERLCHRVLRVSVDGGSTYVVQNWTDTIFARKYDSRRKCDTVYSAQCAKGIVLKKKSCPFRETEVSRYCLWGVACWRRSFKIKGEEHKAVSLPQPDGSEDIIAGTRIRVDHVSQQKAAEFVKTHPVEDQQDTESEVSVNSAESPDTEVEEESYGKKTWLMLSGQDIDNDDNVDEQLTMTVPDFQENLVSQMCTNVGKSSWLWFTGAFKRWRCRSVLNVLCHFGRWSGTLPVDGMDTNLRVSLRENFTVSAVPDWKAIGEKVAVQLVKAFDKQLDLPLNATVSDMELDIGGKGGLLIVRNTSKIYLDAFIDMTQLPLLPR